MRINDITPESGIELRMETGPSEYIYLIGMVAGILIRLWYTSDPISRGIRGTSNLESTLLILVAFSMFVLPPMSAYRMVRLVRLRHAMDGDPRWCIPICIIPDHLMEIAS